MEKEIRWLGMLSERRQVGTLQSGRAIQRGVSQHRRCSRVWWPCSVAGVIQNRADFSGSTSPSWSNAEALRLLVLMYFYVQ